MPEVTQFGQERQRGRGAMNEYTLTTVYTLEEKKKTPENLTKRKREIQH